MASTIRAGDELLTIAYRSDYRRSLTDVMEYVRDVASTGSMVEIIVSHGGGEKKFGFDGDGGDSILLVSSRRLTEEEAEVVTRDYDTLEVAASAWDALSPAEKTNLVKRFPTTRVADLDKRATAYALERHARACGFRRHAAGWIHPTSGALVKILKGNKKLVVKRPGGVSTRHPIKSIRDAKRIVGRAARLPIKTRRPELEFAMTIRPKALRAMLMFETAADDWFAKMSKREQQAYIKAHPRGRGQII